MSDEIKRESLAIGFGAKAWNIVTIRDRMNTAVMGNIEIELQNVHS